MRIYFTDEEKASGLNRAEFEDVVFLADFIEGEEKSYKMTGSAIVEGETYGDFVVGLETENPLSAPVSAADVMNADWEWYEFVFNE